MTNTTSARTPSAIDAVANEYFARLLELVPEFATELGLPGNETAYSDYSPSGVAAHDRGRARGPGKARAAGPGGRDR